MKERASTRLGWCVWVTGLPGSGKSVVSEALLKLLDEKGVHAQLLSVDALRRVLTPIPSYSLKERDTVYATLVYFAQLLTENGVNVVIDATGNLRRFRENARKRIPEFVEAYLECPIEVCMDRETKRGKTHLAPRKIYTRALSGEAPTVPGIGQPYEPPINPEVIVNTAKCQPQECAKKILQKLLAIKAEEKEHSFKHSSRS
jgi:adenylylsulfate kinase